MAMENQSNSNDLITATIQKEYGSDGGVTLRSLGGKLILSHVEKGPHTGGLKRGLEVVTMNNVDCSVLSEVSAQQLLNGDEMVTFLCRELPGARQPGSTVTTVIHKPTPDASVGFKMKVVNGIITIGSMTPGGLAQASDLEVGMQLKSINNFDMKGLNTNQASTLIGQNPGKLEIVAQWPGVAPKTDYLCASVQLEEEVNVDAVSDDGSSATAMAGLEVMTVNSHSSGTPMVVIKSIDPKGPFFGSELRVGMQIVKIQNIECTNAKVTAKEVTALLEDNSQPGENLVVLAQDCSSVRRAPGSFLTVIANKESSDVKLGIVLASRANKLFIKKIANGTLGATTELEPGMVVHSINNISVTHKTSTDAAAILKAAEGKIVFLVQTEGNVLEDPSRFVTALMHKTEADKVGIALKTQGNKLVITKISEEGLARHSDLKVGMKVLKINNVDLAGKKSSDAAKLLADANGVLTIIAQKPDLAPGTHVVASIPIPQVAEGEKKPSLGIKIKQVNGQFVCSGIVEGGIGSKTDLQVGMLIKSLNNVDCASLKTLDKVLGMIINAEGTLNVLAVTPKGTPMLTSQLVTAGVDITPATEVPEGALAYDDETGKITVTEEAATGFLFGTALRAGMEILSINNVEASIFSKIGIETIFKTEGRVMLLAKRQELPKDVLLTEVIEKSEMSMPMGIGIRPKGNRIYISSIKDGTLASATKLMPGMELVSIDNEDCRGMRPTAVARFLRDAPVGKVTIVASTKTGPLTKTGNDSNLSLVTAMIEKGDINNKVGLCFVRKRGGLVVTKINEDTPTAETDLLVGMEVLSLNNTDVSEMASGEAAKILAEAEGVITVLAKRPSLPAGSYVTAAVMKESPETSIGIKLATTKAGSVIIKSVTPQSPASFTELEDGMVLRSINNVQITKSMTAKDVGALLGEHVSSVTILAQTTKEVAMGRASFRSMRSLTSGRSLTDDTIESSLSGEENIKWTKRSSICEGSMPFNMDEIEETPEEDVYKPISPTTSKVKSIEPETITIITGGQKQSFIVQNVVEC